MSRLLGTTQGEQSDLVDCGGADEEELSWVFRSAPSALILAPDIGPEVGQPAVQPDIDWHLRRCIRCRARIHADDHRYCPGCGEFLGAG